MPAWRQDATAQGPVRTHRDGPSRRALAAAALVHVVALWALLPRGTPLDLPPPAPITLRFEKDAGEGAGGGAPPGSGGINPAAPSPAAAPPSPSAAVSPTPPPPVAAKKPPERKPKPAVARPAPVRAPTPAPTERQAQAQASPPDAASPMWSEPTPPPRDEAATAAAPTPAAPAAPGQWAASGGPGGTGATGSAGPGQGASGRGAGSSGAGEGPGDDYFEQLRRWVARYKRWPPGARERKEEGRSIVAFTLARDGTVLDARIDRSSGFPDLDAAVLQMLHDASPVPPLPARYAGDTIVVKMPVDFSIGFFNRLF